MEAPRPTSGAGVAGRGGPGVIGSEAEDPGLYGGGRKRG